MPPAVDARLQSLQSPQHPVATAPCCRHVFQGVHMLMQFGSSAEGMGRPWVRTEGLVPQSRCAGQRDVQLFLSVLFVGPLLPAWPSFVTLSSTPLPYF